MASIGLRTAGARGRGPHLRHLRDLRLGGALLVALAATRGTAAAAPEATPKVLRLDELARQIAPAPDRPATTTEVARGNQTSINFWQLREGMPAHLHRAHEEVIVVEQGRVEVRLGEERLSLGPGDVVLVPRDTVHSGRVLGAEPARGFSIFAPPFDGSDRVPVADPSPAR